MIDISQARGGVSIRTRLLATCGGLALVSGLVGGLGLWAFGSVHAAFQVAVNESLPAIDHLLQADRDMHQAVVSERSLIFMKIDAPGAKEQAKLHGEALRHATERWSQYAAVPSPGGEHERRSAFEAAYRDWADASREVLKVLAQDTASARRDAIDLSTGEAAIKFERARAILAELSTLRLDEARRHASAEQSRAAWLRGLILAAVVAACLISLAASVGLARSIARPLRATVGLLRDVAEGAGDLTKRLRVARRDEIGGLSRWFDSFMDRLHDIIGKARSTALEVASASQQLSTATDRLSAGSHQQASSLEETAASLEEITGTVKQNADSARQANELAAGCRETAEKGRAVVASAVASMGEITQASKRIAAIITVIDEIAFQTNLLALNAAVEAARAGDQGRGFAVVAAEVRNLAQRSAAAAREIKALIQDSVEKVGEGAALVGRSGQSLEEIVAAVTHVGVIIGDIAQASQEQSQGIDQVNRAVAQMDEVVQQNASQTSELASTAQALAHQAAELEGLVGRFRLDGSGPGAPAAGLRRAAAREPAPAAPRAVIRRIERAPQAAARPGDSGEFQLPGEPMGTPRRVAAMAEQEW
jgi:methyl-accepting chemotaxis protein